MTKNTVIILVVAVAIFVGFFCWQLADLKARYEVTQEGNAAKIAAVETKLLTLEQKSESHKNWGVQLMDWGSNLLQPIWDFFSK